MVEVKLRLGDRVFGHTDGETAVESVLGRAAPRRPIIKVRSSEHESLCCS